MEKIFVVVPVYKVEAYLDRCIGSVLNQTFTNWELVLVDDGSPDNCPAICDRYAAEHENITVIHQENGGVSAARNAGIHYVQKICDTHHEWITFLDSDDYVHRQYLEVLYQGAKETGAAISSCNYIRTTSPSSNSFELECPKYRILSPEEYWCMDRTKAMLIWGKLYRVNCFDGILYPVGLIHEDEYTTYKILFAVDRIAYTDIPLYEYLINETSIMHVEWSPRRLAGLDALQEQVNYFHRNGYTAAYAVSAQHLLQHSIKHLMYIKHLSPKYDSYIREVKAWRRRSFRLYAQAVGLKKAIRYWYQVRIRTPMLRVLGRESVFSFLKRRIKRKLGI